VNRSRIYVVLFVLIGTLVLLFAWAGIAQAQDAEFDLAITKVGIPNPVIAGEELIYEIVVTNYGFDFDDGAISATNVTVTDTLPLEVTYLDNTDSCTFSPGSGPGGEDQLFCDLGDIPLGDSRSFEIKVGVPADAVRTQPDGTIVITNTATVASDQPDSDEANNTVVERTFVEDLADLRLSKFVEPEGTVLAGHTFTYTIFVDNLGPSAARQVVITDTLLSSSKVTVQSCAFSVSQGGGSITQFTCTTGNLVSTQFGTDVGTMRTNFLDAFSPGSKGRLRASFRLVAKDDVDVTNTTRTVARTSDPDMSNNFATVSLSVIDVADLQSSSVFGAEVQVPGLPGKIFDSNVVTPMPDPACCNFGGTTVTAGRRIQWDTSTTNNGPSVAENVRMEVLLPFGSTLIENTLTPVPVAGTVPGRCFTEPAGELRSKAICVYDSLAKGETAALQFQVLVDAGLPPGTQLSFDSFASSEQFDPDLSDNYTTIQFDVNTWADLALTKDGLGPYPWKAGEVRTYRYEVDHSGPSLALDVVLLDTLPPEVAFEKAWMGTDQAGGVPLPCTVTSDNRLQCRLGDVSPRLDVSPTLPTVFVDVFIRPDVPDGTIITNTAEIHSATPDPYPDDNTHSVTETVHTEADVEIHKTSEPLKMHAGEQKRYTISVHNIGPSDAQNVTVTDVLPDGVKYEIDTSPYACTQPGSLVAFQAVLNGGNAVPPVDTEGSGLATFVLNTGTNELLYSIDVADLSGATVAAHIHAGAEGVNGPVVVPLFGGSPPPFDSTHPLVGSVAVNPADAAAILANPADFYVNVHTSNFPAGEIRGQLAENANAPLKCELGTLGPGESRQFDVVVKVGTDAPAGSFITNVAIVQSETTLGDPNMANNEARSRNLILGVADLQVSKDQDPKAVLPGGEIEYTLTVSNAGPDDILWATVLDAIPDEVIDATWECTPHGPAACPASGADDINLTVDLPAGWKVVFKVHGTRDPLSVGHVFTNTVTVVAPPGVSDPDLSNNSASVVNRPPKSYLPVVVMTRNLGQGPDLVVEQIFGSTDSVAVVIKNQGTQVVFKPFWVDVYIDPESRPTGPDQLWDDVGRHGLVWGVRAEALPLKPGDRMTLVVGDAYYWPLLSSVSWPLAEGTPLYAQVDSGNPPFGRILETHEMLGSFYNNILGPVPSLGKYPDGPDLVVQQILADGNDVEVVVKNQGTSPVVNGFYVDLYVDPSPAPTVANQIWNDLGAEGLAWMVPTDTLPIQPGETRSLTVGDVYYLPGSSFISWPLPEGTRLYAQVDSRGPYVWGRVGENHEMVGGFYNNVLGPMLLEAEQAASVPPPGADPSAYGLPPRR
jgi:uncharacterized repeat protein (TIGR01451 family)